MSAISDLLENRTDLEKLERDLLLLTGPAAAALGPDVQKLAETARRDLEIAKAAHLDLCARLAAANESERAEARRQLRQRINAGEIKIFDSANSTWRSAAALLIEADQREVEKNRLEMQIAPLVAELYAKAAEPRSLVELSEVIARAADYERRSELTPTGLAALRLARDVLEQGKDRHRQLTLLLRSGSLRERAGVVEQLRRWIANGETEILEAPSDMWRPAGDVLNDALRETQRESARTADEALQRAKDMMSVDPFRALKMMYLALDQSIPYSAADRLRLEQYYLENWRDRPKPGTPLFLAEEKLSPADQAGFDAIHEAVRLRYKNLFNRSTEWLYQFFHSAMSTNAIQWIAQAEDSATPLNKALELINRSEALARERLPNSLEIPEVLVRGSRVLLNKNEPKLAHDLLERARPLYTLERPDKTHRHAVTTWLLGCLEYGMDDHLYGYSKWKEARAFFNDLMLEARRTGQNDKANWYKARLSEIETLGIQTFESVYFAWVNQFETPSMPDWFIEYRQTMDKLVRQKKTAELRKKIQAILSNAQNERKLEILWQAEMEAAFFEYQISDYKSAIFHLEQASIGFQLDHRGAVALWLLGMLQWWLPSQRTDAIVHWQQSIHFFEQLAKEADRCNQQSRRTWYEAQTGMMKKSVRDWMLLTKP